MCNNIVIRAPTCGGDPTGRDDNNNNNNNNNKSNNNNIVIVGLWWVLLTTFGRRPEGTCYYNYNITVLKQC